MGRVCVEGLGTLVGYVHQSDETSLETAAAVVAGRQYGNITAAQLLEIGFTRSAITYRARTGRFFAEHRGVYSVGRPAGTALEKAAAAVLACGDGAALSHSSALSLWGLVSYWQFPLHVTTPVRRRRPGIVVHETQVLTDRDIRERQGIRVTSPARALLESARGLTRTHVARLIADACRKGLLDLDALNDMTARFSTHRGRTPLLEVFEELDAPTRSEFEDAFLAFCGDHGLPRPLVNVKVAGYEVDALFVEEQLIVQLDGWRFHRDRVNFESDRERDAQALEVGLPTVRITWGRMMGRPEREARRLTRILERRRRDLRAAVSPVSGPARRSAAARA